MLGSSEIPFTVRAFCPADAQACHRLYQDGLFGGRIAENDTGLDLDDIQSVYMKAAGNHFWVADVQGEGVVGMIGVQHHDEGVGEIRRLRVAPTYLRRGIGSALLEVALRFCQDRGYLKITLDTFIERDPAINLFEKFHFRHYRTRNVSGTRMERSHGILPSSIRDPPSSALRSRLCCDLHR